MQPVDIPISDGSGKLERYPDFPCAGLPPRHVDVWLPPGYAANTPTRYPVIYMHDGQNLFDPALAFTGCDWGVDEAVTRWMQRSGQPGAIVVGVWNSGQRWRDYMPAQPLSLPAAAELRASFIQQQGGEPVADLYLQFLAESLKPLIDARYATLPDSAHTLVMGSSMGGLASLYAVCRHPHVFGGAGCLSTHWLAGGNILVDALGALLPPAGRHRLYFDYGTATLDAGYEPFQQRFDSWLRKAGYRHGADWVTRKFAGAEHNERAWRERLDLPLGFLLEGL